jgi:accessory gene regulator protein AgrB
MAFKKVAFYFFVCLSFLLMFMNYIITGFAMLFISAFVFAPGQMKPNEKWQRFYQAKTIKKIRRTIMIFIYLGIVVLLFIYPKINLILPLFFIAIALNPAKSDNNTIYYDHDDYLN